MSVTARERREYLESIPWITYLDKGVPCQASAHWKGRRCRNTAHWKYVTLRRRRDDPFGDDGLPRTRIICMAHVFSQYGLWGMREWYRYDDWKAGR
jgi:hypothetical protein